MSGRAAIHSDALCLWPTELQEQLDRALRLTRRLSRLLQRVVPGEALFVWLLGRDEEIRTFVDALLGDCTEGTIEPSVAAHSIGAYVGELESALRDIYRASLGARGAMGGPVRVRHGFHADFEPTLHEPR